MTTKHLKYFALGFVIIFCVNALAAEKTPPPPPPCAAKTKSKISELEKQAAGFAKKVDAFKTQHKSLTPTNGRMPAAFCKDGKNGMVQAAHLAREGFPLTDALELIENAPNSGQCAPLARSARVKVDELFMGLNSAYIQTCSTPAE